MFEEGGGGGKYQKKIRAQKKSRKKISCTTNLLGKKEELGMNFPGKIFYVILKKYIVQRNVAKKKFLQAVGG
jgi:hypothetical protein